MTGTTRPAGALVIPYAVLGTMVTVILLASGAWLNMSIRVTTVEQALKMHSEAASKMGDELTGLREDVGRMRVNNERIKTLVEMGQ